MTNLTGNDRETSAARVVQKRASHHIRHGHETDPQTAMRRAFRGMNYRGHGDPLAMALDAYAASGTLLRHKATR